MNAERRVAHLRECIAREKQSLPYADGTAYLNTKAAISVLQDELDELTDLLACRDAQASVEQLTRQLGVVLNGEVGAAKEARLCDVVAQLAKKAELLGVSEKGLLHDFDEKSVLLDCVREVIRFTLEDVDDATDALDFLEAWSNADWDTLRGNFPEAADLIYAADPCWEGWNR